MVLRKEFKKQVIYTCTFIYTLRCKLEENKFTVLVKLCLKRRWNA